MKAFALLAALALAGCSRSPQPVAARSEPKEAVAKDPNAVTIPAAMQRESGIAVVTAESRSVPLTIRSTARLTNDENRTWRVGAITEGRIVSVLANPGDRVERGRVLARLHSHVIHETRAEYRKALTELERARTNFAFAQRVRDRARRLYDLKAGSLEQVEHAETELRNANTAVSNSQVDVERALAHLVEFLGIPPDSPEHHKEGGAEDEDDLIPVKSPAAGIVLTRSVTPGTVVTESSDLFLISDLASLWAVAEVTEEHLSNLRAGMPVRVTVQAYPGRAFSGTIGKLGEMLDPATRTIKVRVNLPNPGGLLKPEMYASTEIDIGGSEPGIFIPAEAVQEVRGEKVVFVRVTPDRFEVRPVETGRTLGTALEIRRGVKAGDAVASRGTFVLKSEFLKASLAEE